MVQCSRVTSRQTNALSWLLPACSSLLLLGLLVLTSGCGGAHAEPPKKKALTVRYAVPVERPVTEYVYFTGRTDAVQSVEIRARVTGYLMHIGFVSGDEVKKDQVLFKIDPRPYKAILDQAEGQVALAKAQLKLAVADYARAQEIAKTPGAISQQDLDKYLASQGQAEASVQANEAAAEQARLNLQFTDVTSPIDGLVSRNLLTIGNLVTQDNTLLTTVVSLDPMYAYFDVDERSMLMFQRLIREGKIPAVKPMDSTTPVDLGLSTEGTEYPHAGFIDFVNTEVSATTGTVQVRGVFENPSLGENIPRLLKPGLFVRIRIPVGKPFSALLVPQSAVAADQGRKYVLVVNAENKVEYRPITTGAVQPDGLQVITPVMVVKTANGLEFAAAGQTGEPSIKPGERVIVSGLQRARPGTLVDPIEANLADPPPQ